MIVFHYKFLWWLPVKRSRRHPISHQKCGSTKFRIHTAVDCAPGNLDHNHHRLNSIRIIFSSDDRLHWAAKIIFQFANWPDRGARFKARWLLLHSLGSSIYSLQNPSHSNQVPHIHCWLAGLLFELIVRFGLSLRPGAEIVRATNQPSCITNWSIAEYSRILYYAISVVFN